MDTFIQALGGLGLFLLGMVIMTEGLKKLAADRLRRVLFNYTKTPATGALTGALTTAVIQSSSATTVAAVGFVGAGLMTFPNALGIVFGANIGTTITGWMVALLGFKFSIASIGYPLVFIGVALHLFMKGKIAKIGLVLAGFALLFVGLNHLQQVMIEMKNLFDFSQFPANSLFGILKLVGIGLVFTLVTQSSSAGVAVAMTALFGGLIEFEQAAAMIIGMDVGSSVKSMLASIGGSKGAKRTGLSHVVYNFWTATIALILIFPYVWIWQAIYPNGLLEHAEIALVAFHSLFNLLGVLLILPLSSRFARLIEKMLPEDGTNPVQFLEQQLLRTPEMALNAVQITLFQIWRALLKILYNRMFDQDIDQQQLIQLQLDLDQTQAYLDRIHIERSQAKNWKRLVALIHALDHLQRLHERCEEEADRAQASKQFPALIKANSRLIADIQMIQRLANQQQLDQAIQQSKDLYLSIKQDSEGYRRIMVEQMGRGELEADQCWDSLEAIRWMERVSKHLYRISYHLELATLATARK